ncbi:hypothetical protein GCM10023205_20860 [Yinghuangia aomiensis]|uniref:Uncharacterized protein n=1 Tax=Yinghuangia aomiensis TaxID=676205 RepID=A0ABP9H2A5_9ACTN
MTSQNAAVRDTRKEPGMRGTSGRLEARRKAVVRGPGQEAGAATACRPHRLNAKILALMDATPDAAKSKSPGVKVAE